MAIDGPADDGSFTSIEQEDLPPGQPLEEALHTIAWPESVSGCAAVIERLVLPPDVDDDIPDDPTAAELFAREHPDRQEVRMVAGVTRAGASYCALRLRAHDDEQSVVNGTELVPGLLDLLHATFTTRHRRVPRHSRAGAGMSNPFDDPAPSSGPTARSGRQAQRPPTGSRRPGALVITAIVLVLAFMLLSGFASFWTERLWFRSVDYSGVFTTLLLTRIGLFFVFAGLMAATVAVAMAMAYRFRPVLWPGMPGMPDDGMDRYRELLAPRMTWVIAGAAIVMGLFAGGSATGQWRNYSLWRHGTSFGTDDPYFNKDVGFYVFDLPFWHYVVDFVMALAVVGLLASVLVNYLFGGIRLSARPGERLTSAAQIQVSALLALFVLAKAVDYWLDRFDLVTNSGSIFTGMDYTDDKAVLPAKEILAGIAIVCAVLFLANIWRRTWLLPSVGVALFALSAIILGLIVPSVVQAIRVNPNVPDREGPYIKENIDATRKAYALDQVEVEHGRRHAGLRRRAARHPRRDDLQRAAGRPQGRQPRSSSSSSRCVPTTR